MTGKSPGVQPRHHRENDPDVVERSKRALAALQLDEYELSVIAKLPKISEDVADEVAALLAPGRRRSC